MVNRCRVSLGTAIWDHHPDAILEIARLRAADPMAWQRLRQLIERSRTRRLSNRLCRCQLASAPRVGEVIVDQARDPAVTVRYFFSEPDGIPETLGLHVLVKPGTYEELGAQPTRDLQNQAIAIALGRIGTHPLAPTS